MTHNYTCLEYRRFSTEQKFDEDLTTVETLTTVAQDIQDIALITEIVLDSIDINATDSSSIFKDLEITFQESNPCTGKSLLEAYQNLFTDATAFQNIAENIIKIMYNDTIIVMRVTEYDK